MMDPATAAPDMAKAATVVRLPHRMHLRNSALLRAVGGPNSLDLKIKANIGWY